MQLLLSFVIQVLALSLLTMVFEYLMPSGKIKRTASAAARFVYIAAICDEIIGIFGRWGV